MPDLVVVYWRDIPAQVIAKRGRTAAKRQLSERFEKAIDRAAMRAKLRDTDSYLNEWRRADPVPCGDDLEAAASRFKLDKIAGRPNAGATAICGKVEAELAEMDDEEAAEFLSSYGLHESGLVRLIRKSYELQGLISFFTAGEDECRAWTIPVGSKAPQGAGAIHSDLEHHFIRAETIRWDALLEAGSEAAARAKGTLRLEGKEYVVQDGDVMHIRHSG